MSAADTPAPAEALRIHGGATAEEIAAVVSVLSAVGGGAPAAPPPPSRWGHPSELIRRRLQPGPDAWTYSARPIQVMG